MPAIEEHDYVYLPKSLCLKLKQFRDSKEQEKLIEGFIKECKDDLKLNLESYDDELLIFKASMIKAKNAFEKVKQEELDASYKIWEKYDNELFELKNKVNNARLAIEPLKNDLKSLNEEFGKLPIYNIENAVKLIGQLDTVLSFNGETSKMLKFLVSNYKKE